MKIAQLFNGHVPPLTYGGIERMVFWLSRALLELGHEVVVVCQGDGEELRKIGAKHIPWPESLENLKEQLADIDVLHFHQPFPSTYRPPCPYIITEHGNHRGKQKILPNTVFLSHSHANNHGAEYFVQNGVPLDEYPYCKEKAKTMLFMAKLAWKKKNAKTAINLALDTDTPLDVCGGDLWNEPKINGLWRRRAKADDKAKLLRDRGSVGGEDKLRLLQNSGLLFYIVNWQEPFALAPHEAMATGTPVICSPNGALKEYIVHENNGYIVSSYKDAIEAINRHNDMTECDRQEMYLRCRDSAYDILDSAKGYVDAYKTVLKDEFLYPVSDAIKFKFSPARSVKIKKVFS